MSQSRFFSRKDFGVWKLQLITEKAPKFVHSMGKSNPQPNLRLKLILPVGQQGPEFNGYLVGRGNFREIDLNRNFPDLNALLYYYEKTKGRNHHLPLPDNWEQQVSGGGHLCG